MKQIELRGITQADVQLLDTLWALDTMEDVAAFRSLQTVETQKRMDVLVEMIRVTIIDGDVEDLNGQYEAGAAVLERFTLQ